MTPAPLTGPGRSVFLRTTAPTSPGTPISERLHACVRNTGNYFFEEALLRHLQDVDVVQTIEALPPRIRTLVLSMSNFISPATDLGYLCDALSGRQVEQVVMVGAGAQAYTYADPVHLTQGTQRFLSYVADRSVTIGVRGYYTADVLERLGIRNVSVIGCPSAFWSGRAPEVAPVSVRTPARVAVHCSPVGHFRDKVSALLAHGMRHGADYVMQSETWMSPLLHVGGDEDLLTEGLLYYGYPECDPGALRAWLAGHLRLFFDVRCWLDQMQAFDLVYGSRFHGNMAAIQAGVPALNMPFDTRTRELCEYLNLPTLPLHDFDVDIPVEALRDRADFSLFNQTFPSRLRSYAEFLSRSGLAHTLTDLGERDLDDRATRVRARSIAQLLCDTHSADAACRFDLAPKLEQRLRSDRAETARHAADTGAFEGVTLVGQPIRPAEALFEQWRTRDPADAAAGATRVEAGLVLH